MKRKPIIRRNKRCKICMSDWADAIDSMLAEGMRQKDILAILTAKRPDLGIRAYNLSIHNTRHRVPSKQELAFEESNERKAAPTPSPELLDQAEQLANYKLCLSLDKFCDLIINQLIIELADGRIKPSVGDALRAAELKKMLSSTSASTDSLLELFTQISTANGLVHKN